MSANAPSKWQTLGECVWLVLCCTLVAVYARGQLHHTLTFLHELLELLSKR